MPNEMTPIFDKDHYPITAHTVAGVTGKRFVKVGAVASLTDGCYSVATCTAGALAIGVAGRDVAALGKVTVHQEGILKVTAGEALVVGDLIASGATGKAMKAVTGDYVVGIAMIDAANNTDAEIKMLGGGFLYGETADAWTAPTATALRTAIADSAWDAVATTGASNTTPYGFTTSAQADDIVATLNGVVAEQTALRKYVATLVADLIAAGYVKTA